MADRDPWAAVWFNDAGERGIRVAPRGEAWTWISRQQAKTLVAELQAALERLEKRERKRRP